MAEVSKSKYVVNITWDDVPHLDDDEKQALYEATPPYLRDARAKGIPSLGSGAIYPIPQSEIEVQPFEIPEHWKRCAAMDVGWERTAALWGAIDPDSNVCYVYSEYYKGQAEPVIHSEGIKSRESWIPIAIDPASRGRSQIDGQKLFALYSSYGLKLVKANNAVEAGIYNVWNRLSFGQLKIFSTLQNFFTEYRLYRRDESGNIVKKQDHLVDCLRYLTMTGINIATYEPQPRKRFIKNTKRDRTTGY